MSKIWKYAEVLQRLENNPNNTKDLFTRLCPTIRIQKQLMVSSYTVTTDPSTNLGNWHFYYMHAQINHLTPIFHSTIHFTLAHSSTNPRELRESKIHLQPVELYEAPT